MNITTSIQNFYNTHTINNSVCALLALNGLGYAAYHVAQAVQKIAHDHINDGAIAWNPVYRDLQQVGRSLSTAAFFALGALNPVMGWVVPSLAIIQPSLWGEEEPHSFMLSPSIKAICLGFSSLAEESISEIKPVLEAAKKAAGLALVFFVIQRINNALVAKGISPISWVAPFGI